MGCSPRFVGGECTGLWTDAGDGGLEQVNQSSDGVDVDMQSVDECLQGDDDGARVLDDFRRGRACCGEVAFSSHAWGNPGVGAEAKSDMREASPPSGAAVSRASLEPTSSTTTSRVRSSVALSRASGSASSAASFFLDLVVKPFSLDASTSPEARFGAI